MGIFRVNEGDNIADDALHFISSENFKLYTQSETLIIKKTFYKIIQENVFWKCHQQIGKHAWVSTMQGHTITLVWQSINITSNCKYIDTNN